MYINKIKNKGLSVNNLAFILSSIFAFFATFLYYPISLVLSGQWKLNQQIELFSIDNVTLFGLDLQFGVVSIRFYSICIVIGMLTGYSLVLFLAKKHNIAGTIIDRLFIGLVVIGLIGARLFYVIFNWEVFAGTPLNIVTEITRGGLAVFGTIISSIIYIWIYCKRFKFNFFEFLDIVSPGLLLGQIIGRFGNFFNYEAYGGPTSVFWKMYVPQTANVYQDINEKYFHPTFLYEIIPNTLLFLIILFSYQKLTSKRSGLVFAVYAIGYGFIRFITEFFRLDALTMPIPKFLVMNIGFIHLEQILVSQVTALILCVIGIIIFFIRRKVIYLANSLGEINI